MTIWFTSDLHLSHQRILEFCPERPGDTVEEMNRALLDNILEDVAEGDTLYLIGDVAFGHRNETLKIFTELRDAGIILRLVSGNHDYSHQIGHKQYLEWGRVYQVFFDSVKEEMYLDRNFIPAVDTDDTVFVLNHFPLEADSIEDERYNQQMIESCRPLLLPGEVLIHGHLHSPEWKTSHREIHVGVDADWTEFGVKRHHPIPDSAILEAARSLGYDL